MRVIRGASNADVSLSQPRKRGRRRKLCRRKRAKTCSVRRSQSTGRSGSNRVFKGHLGVENSGGWPAILLCARINVIIIISHIVVCLHQCCTARTEHIHYTCQSSDDAHSHVCCVSGSAGVLHLRCRHRRSLLPQRYVWHVTIVTHAFESCCASHVNSHLQTPPFLRLPHST